MAETPPEQRRPCPVCGSTARTANVTITETSKASTYLKTHTKHRDGGPKIVREVIEGDDYYRKTGKWSLMRRLIDHANDWYEEIFRDRDTQKIIHQKAEPLSEHKSKLKPPQSN
jgi:hypothetical protein